jgi:hypothetical protein
VEQDETGEAGATPPATPGSRNRAESYLPRHHHNYLRRGSLQAQSAEGGPVGFNMELILMSTTGTATLLMLQFIDFVRRERVTELVSRLRAIHPRLTACDALTMTLPVAASYAS